MLLHCCFLPRISMLSITQQSAISFLLLILLTRTYTCTNKLSRSSPLTRVILACRATVRTQLPPGLQQQRWHTENFAAPATVPDVQKHQLYEAHAVAAEAAERERMYLVCSSARMLPRCLRHHTLFLSHSSDLHHLPTHRHILQHHSRTHPPDQLNLHIIILTSATLQIAFERERHELEARKLAAVAAEGDRVFREMQTIVERERMARDREADLAASAVAGEWVKQISLVAHTLFHVCTTCHCSTLLWYIVSMTHPPFFVTIAWCAESVPWLITMPWFIVSVPWLILTLQSLSGDFAKQRWLPKAQPSASGGSANAERVR
jgi:hypothetical protein